MLDMLEGHDSFFLSKMMLKSMPEMIAQSSEMMVKFFNTNVYTSPLMETAELAPFPDD